MSHRNARLTVHGRRLLVERVRVGRPVAHVAAEMGISRATAHKWVRRWRTEGESGLHDRSSRPRTTPHRTPAMVEAHVCQLRQARKLGPARIGPALGMPASTVHRILGRQAGRARRSSMGFDYVHSAVDDHSRLAYSEIHPDEKADTCAGFLRRAAAFFATCSSAQKPRAAPLTGSTRPPPTLPAPTAPWWSKHSPSRTWSSPPRAPSKSQGRTSSRRPVSTAPSARRHGGARSRCWRTNWNGSAVSWSKSQPPGTSRRCSACGLTTPDSREDQATFVCKNHRLRLPGERRLERRPEHLAPVPDRH
ncbi:transposase-like protein [Streptomyces sp. V3I7]|nr:transposase-like protein [Streptomyces sp. V3I7]